MTFVGHVFTYRAYFKAALLRTANGKLTAHQAVLNGMDLLTDLKNNTMNKKRPK